MRTRRTSKYLLLSKNLAKNPKTPLEIAHNILNWCEKNNGPMWLIFLEKAYCKKNKEIKITQNEISKKLGIGRIHTIAKVTRFLNLIGLVKMERNANCTGNVYTLAEISLDTLILNILKNEKYLYEKVLNSISKRNKIEKMLTKFSKYLGAGKYDPLSDYIKFILKNGISKIEKNYSDISWKTRRVSCGGQEEKKQRNISIYKSMSATPTGILEKDKKIKNAHKTPYDTVTIDVLLMAFQGYARRLDKKILGGNGSENIGVDITFLKNNLDGICLIKDLVIELEDRTNKELKSLRSYKAAADPRFTLQAYKIMVRLGVISKTDSVLKNSDGSLRHSSKKKALFILTKTIKKWDSNLIIDDNDYKKLEETARLLKECGLLKEYRVGGDIVKEYAEFVIYDCFLKAKKQNMKTFFGWFNKKDRIIKFKQERSLLAAQEKFDKEQAARRRYEIGQKYKPAGWAYKPDEKEDELVCHDFVDTFREVVQKKMDGTIQNNNGTKFLFYKRLLKVDAYNNAIWVRFYRHEHTGEKWCWPETVDMIRLKRLKAYLNKEDDGRIDSDFNEYDDDDD